ncbi:MAG: hypothetical protein MZW92_65890 [Comamonadaceae bacterium]|nr:hypothetical protein [Comamonadaceae bacterium]
MALMAGLVGFTFGIGVTCAVGLALVLEPAVMRAGWLHLDADLPCGPSAPCCCRRWWLYLGIRPASGAGQLILGAWQLQVPGLGMAWRQIALALIELSCAALALWALLPAEAAPPFAVFLGVYVVAVVAGIVSSRARWARRVRDRDAAGLAAGAARRLARARASATASSITCCRCPWRLLLASILGLRERRARLASAWATARPLFVWLAPAAAGASVFVTGALLLFSGSPAGRGSTAAFAARHGPAAGARDFAPAGRACSGWAC